MNTLEKEFIPYEQALALKQLGFDEPCFGSWETDYAKVPTYTHSCSQFYKNSNHPKGKVTAPTFSQAFRWFREKHGLRNSITDFIDNETGIEWDYEIAIIGTDIDERGNYKPLIDYSVDDETRKFKTYEEAELASLKKLIEIVKNKQNEKHTHTTNR